MKLCAIFESRNISDGNYPPLRTGSVRYHLNLFRSD